MHPDCYPATALPHVSPLFRDYVADLTESADTRLDGFYSPLRRDNRWMQHAPLFSDEMRQNVVELLREQNRTLAAGPAVAANLDRLAEGAAAVVTGQQVTLFGGPLLTLLKAATAIRRASDASRAGHPHVPIFWLASEDHDFAEVGQIALRGEVHSAGLRNLRLPANPTPGRPVGEIPLGGSILPLLEELREYLGDGPVYDLLESSYTPTATFASAFATFISRVFSDHGLIVIDAGSRPFHALASTSLELAITRVDEIHAALVGRSLDLERCGYHAQVTVGASSSLLFLIDSETGVRTALKKVSRGGWSAGSQHYSTADLLEILKTAPERLSPNVLLRPVVQDTLLPTSAYIGGPAEIAYFAQSQVVYEAILRRTTPILPRLSATLVEPRLQKILERHQLSLPEVFTTPETLRMQLGARAISAAGKRILSATGNALDRELAALSEWMHAQDDALGHTADIAASKMLYQMNRMRRLAAAFMTQKEQSLARQAAALCGELYPEGNLQERVLAGAWFLSRCPSLVELLIAHAAPGCAHRRIAF